MSMKILLTGFMGFIGSHILEAIKDDHEVKCIDFRDGSCNQGEISSILVDPEIDIVINAAGEIFDHTRMMMTNVVGVENLANQSKRLGFKLIHFSTNSIFGRSYYGLTKKFGEEIIKSINPPNWLVLRMTSVFEKGGKGDSPGCRFTRGEKIILGDGFHIKDHVHVLDVVKAVLMAVDDYEMTLRTGQEGVWIRDINLASGKPATINEIFSRLGKGEPEYIMDKKPDMRVSTLDIGRALKLGWRPSWNIYQEGGAK